VHPNGQPPSRLAVSRFQVRWLPYRSPLEERTLPELAHRKPACPIICFLGGYRRAV
jgi:hypothetical protein